jgi:hypothetical protein
MLGAANIFGSSLRPRVCSPCARGCFFAGARPYVRFYGSRGPGLPGPSSSASCTVRRRGRRPCTGVSDRGQQLLAHGAAPVPVIKGEIPLWVAGALGSVQRAVARPKFLEQSEQARQCARAVRERGIATLPIPLPEQLERLGTEPRVPRRALERRSVSRHSGPSNRRGAAAGPSA